ncbi:hypothetical protein ACTJJ0_25885 [Chitinophaga sp. 22321]|uniref:Lipoprotein n=1 Tax=Chitinophaga hostae TaxID=2831022 RepID=A0ABS5J573_9BACT|nr:hypothetical protein [Chitinophaga hostae]MBS0030380.1 hypothetical protein [Chitinophaga hostae]
MKRKVLSFIALSLLAAACHPAKQPTLAPETIYQEPGVSVITSFFNNRQQTISTLYGNAEALKAARGDSNMVAGAVYRLITWKQKGNPLWFGGNINGAVKTIESIQVSGDGVTHYALVSGVATGAPAERTKFVLGLKASVFP